MRLLVLTIAALVLGAGAVAQDSKPRLVKRVRPKCTASAMQAALRITTHLDIAVDEKGIGTLRDVQPPLSHGMDGVVRQAVSEWRWMPAADNSGAVPANTMVDLTVHCGS